MPARRHTAPVSLRRKCARFRRSIPSCSVFEASMGPPSRWPSAEISSIILALLMSILAFVFFKYFPDYSPDRNWIRGLPGWLALGYITIQLWMLLDSALRIRPTSVID